MNFATLKANVNSAMARDDVPDYIYTLTTAGVNRDCRFLDMQQATTLDTSTNPQTLPGDFQSVVSAHIDYSGTTYVLKQVTDHTAHLHEPTRLPKFFSIRDGAMYFAPDPDGTYTVTLQYIAALASLSDDADTNDVLTRYPGLYLYQALTHAAIWRGDREMEQSFGNAYAAELNLAKRDDMNRRMSTGITSRSLRL